MFSGELLLRHVMRAVVAVLLLDQRVLLSNTSTCLPVNDDANLKWLAIRRDPVSFLRRAGGCFSSVKKRHLTRELHEITQM